MEKNKEFECKNLAVFKVYDYSSKARKEYSYLSVRYITPKGEYKELTRVFMKDNEMALLDYVEEF